MVCRCHHLLSPAGFDLFSRLVRKRRHFCLIFVITLEFIFYYILLLPLFVCLSSSFFPWLLPPICHPLCLVAFLIYKRSVIPVVLVSLADVACERAFACCSVRALNVSLPDSCRMCLMWTITWHILLPSVLCFGASIGFCFCISPCKK